MRRLKKEGSEIEWKKGREMFVRRFEEVEVKAELKNLSILAEIIFSPNNVIKLYCMRKHFKVFS